MEISKVIEKLARFDLRQVAACPEKTFIETHKMLKPGQQRFFRACLYVGYASDLPKQPDEDTYGNVIVIDDAPVPDALLGQDRFNVYVVDGHTNQFDVLNLIADIMIDEARIVAAMRRFLDAVYAGHDLKTLADIAYQELGNPVFVNDPAYKILAMGYGLPFNNETLEQEKELGYVHAANVENMRRDGIVGRHRHVGVEVYRSERPEFGEQWLFAPVFINDVEVATVAAVDNDRPFKGFEEELMARFARVVALYLGRNDLYREDVSVRYGYFLSDLIKGKTQDERLLSQRCQLIGYRLHAWSKLMVITDPASAMPPSKARNVTQLVRQILPGSCWTVHMHNVVVLVSRDHRGVFWEGERERLEEVLSANGLCCGVSNAFAGLSAAKEHYQQAYRAVEMVAALGGGRLVGSYSEMVTYHVAHTLLKRNQAESFCPEWVAALRDYDRENQSVLTDTLRRYLACAGDPVKASEELCVHRNTLLYRLRRIRDVADVDLSDGNVRLACQLYFVLEELEQGGVTNPWTTT